MAQVSYEAKGGFSVTVDRLFQSERVRHMSRPPVGQVIALDKGDPSFRTPGPVIQATNAAMVEGRTHYPPPTGDPDLRSALAATVSIPGGIEYTGEEILVTSGATSGIFAAMASLLSPGDEVLISDPAYSLYQDVAIAVGATPVRVPLTDDLRIDTGYLSTAWTPKTRLLIVNNPCNPAATVLSWNETRAIADFVLERGLWLLVDEAYDHIVFDGRKVIPFGTFKDLSKLLVVVNTFSKTYAMTGWRVGWIAARQGVTAAIALVHQTAVGPVNSFCQRGALAALSVDGEWIKQCADEYDKRRKVVLRAIASLPFASTPIEGTFYAFLRVTSGVSSASVTEAARRRGVAVRNGTEFGAHGEGYVRISFAGEPRDIEAGIARLGAACLDK